MEVLSPFSGKLIKVLVSQGAKVSEDDEIFVIEAMKMETPIYAPCGGTVKELKVKENQDIEADDILAVIE
ncbi:MAG: biotin/lipoyl-binding protein [Spirochaetes bacterium]|nr:biotin/lipoyl-binding protein [Spirochaetota bacterium]